MNSDDQLTSRNSYSEDKYRRNDDDENEGYDDNQYDDSRENKSKMEVPKNGSSSYGWDSNNSKPKSKNWF